MAKTVFKIDFSKVKTIGGGSVSTFCKRNGLKRTIIYQMNGSTNFRDGSQTQAMAEKLINLGVGGWVEIGENLNNQNPNISGLA